MSAQSIISEWGFLILSALGFCNLIAIVLVWKNLTRLVIDRVNVPWANWCHWIDNRNMERLSEFRTLIKTIADKVASDSAEEGTNHRTSSGASEHGPTVGQSMGSFFPSESFEQSPASPSDAPKTHIAEISISFTPGVTVNSKIRRSAGA